MKKIFRFVALVLATTLFCSVVTGCSCNDDSKDGSKNETSYYTRGVHVYNVKETNNKLVSGGKSDYVIVISDNAGKWLTFAADELQLLFKEATGAELPVKKESEAKDFSKKIVLGVNETFTAAGLTADASVLDRNGFIIKTVDDNIYIAGAYEDGTNFGVYKFLAYEFNFDCVNDRYYYIDKGVIEVSLKEYDVTDVPDHKIRNSGTFIANDDTAMRRMGYTDREDGSTFIGSASAHTAFYYLPPETYQEEHPDWYSTDGYQLCYTAHGNEQEYEAMQNAAFEKMKAEFMKNKEGFLFNFSQEDKVTWCNCEACSKSYKDYNQSNGAVVVKFCNDLAKKMKDWMATEEGKPYARDFKILFLAYDLTINAPAAYDEKTGEYAPIDGLVCDDNVAVMFAPIQMDYQISILDPDNETFYKAFLGWKAISKNFNVYTYMSNYDYFLVPFDSFNGMRDFYQLVADCNAYWFFDLGVRPGSAATGWQMLKIYLSSKLSWNVNSDVDLLTDEFFKKSYGDGAKYMREWYDEYRVHSKHLIENGEMRQASSVYKALLKEDFWPRNLLSSWIEKTELALNAIEAVKYVDYAEYQRLYDNITLERISLNYMLISLYEEDFDSSYILNAKYQTKEDCERLGVTHTAEANSSGAISLLWQEWGIS